MSRSEVVSAPAVLLVEDDPTIGHHLLLGLQSNGYHTHWCRTGAAALVQFHESKPAVVLLDLGLPDMDGVEITRTLRSDQPDVLLIIMTARSSEIDVIVGLDAGADDYLVKPFSLSVLLARLRAHLRSRPPPAAEHEVIDLGVLTVDLGSRRCLMNGREVRLRPKEFDLLAALATRRGQAVSREDLMYDAWDENWYGPTKTLDVTMAALRRQLSQAAQDQVVPEADIPVITTLRGHGYRLEEAPVTSSSTDPGTRP
jgi:DNA-binding response OmpR family regulator